MIDFTTARKRQPAIKTKPPRSAYIHVPFCAHRCGYCDFTLVAGKDHLVDSYLDALEIELHTLAEPCEIDTLYLGGGTPTHPTAEQLRRLFDILQQRFQLANGYEFSIEANPVDLTTEKIAVLQDAGVNRVSLGVQSFDAGVLTFLERDHREADIEEGVRRLQGVIGNISFDLIFGVPEQTVAVWRETLKKAVELGASHVSTYGLTFEKGTSFWSRREKGSIKQIGSECEREMYGLAMDELAACGFEQYEISSFALPGFRCRHNEVYWSGRPYYAFGPGAARYLDGCRETNHRSVTTWLKRILAGQSPVADKERLSDEDRAREAAVLGLRRCQGINKQEFAQRTGFNLHALAGEAIERHKANGLLEENATHVRLTREGLFLADTVIVDFL